MKFTDEARIERAKTIEDKDVQILERSEARIASKVRDYQLVVDLNRRVIAHDCPDWARQSQAKRFCKHVARVFFALQRDKATEILRRILKESKEWEFKALR